MQPRYQPGTTIRRCEVLHGQLWMEHPVTVVADDGDVLAVLLEPGSTFVFPGHPFGPHPWGAHEQWGASIVLQLLRAGDKYGVWKFYETDGTFRHWYVNFEAPIVRHDDGFDTDDYGLDLIVHPDGRREWKDVEHLNAQMTQGRITLETVGEVLAAAEDVIGLLDEDERWWAPWDDWTPA
ncbi:DUF402 domain-containing protein [Nocardioides sp. InS609-2]|uniref:DUF402 domain-containing protein n=1 Tax=Nocardioides sp. InS609-2 TaxID=2760705 RepID=UPI0020BF7343|nr:DUF402 domain-containing protein [Nocardioides sp. InS609-2]